MADVFDPLTLAGVITAGIAGVILTVHLTGGSQRARIADAQDARAVFALDFPDAQVQDVVLADDHRAALLALDNGHFGAVTVLGKDRVARRFSRSALRRVRADARGLTLRTGDFGAPTIRVALAHPDHRAAWHARLEAG